MKTLEKVEEPKKNQTAAQRRKTKKKNHSPIDYQASPYPHPHQAPTQES